MFQTATGSEAMTENANFGARVFSLVALTLIGVGLFLVLRPFLGPILWAGLLALLLFPANLTLRRGLHGRKAAAAVLLTTAAVLIVVIPAIMLAGMFFAQATDLIAWLQTAAKQHHIARLSDVLAIPAVDRLVRAVSERMPISTDQLQETVIARGQQLIQALLALAGSIFAGALGAFVNVVFSLLLLFFFLRDGEEIVRRGLLIVPVAERRKAQLADHLAAVIRGVVLGTLATAIVQGMLVGISFAIVGLRSPIVFAVLGMLASLVPFVGAALVWVPAAVALLVQGSWGAALFLTVWCLAIVHSSDNVIRPAFVSSHAKISTLPVFIGLFGGVTAFGPIGMFLGPVLVALVLALLEFAEEPRTETLAESGPEHVG